MPNRYRTFDVTYSHSDSHGSNETVDRAIVTVYGSTELAIRKAVEQDRPGHTGIVLLTVTPLR